MEGGFVCPDSVSLATLSARVLGYNELSWRYERSQLLRNKKLDRHSILGRGGGRTGLTVVKNT